MWSKPSSESKKQRFWPATPTENYPDPGNSVILADFSYQQTKKSNSCRGRAGNFEKVFINYLEKLLSLGQKIVYTSTLQQKAMQQFWKPSDCSQKMSISNYYFFHLSCLWYITKYKIWIIGKQPRSVENIYLETLFVTKPYESSPSPQRLKVRSHGGPYVQCFCYDIYFGFGS